MNFLACELKNIGSPGEGRQPGTVRAPASSSRSPPPAPSLCFSCQVTGRREGARTQASSLVKISINLGLGRRQPHPTPTSKCDFMWKERLGRSNGGKEVIRVGPNPRGLSQETWAAPVVEVDAEEPQDGHQPAAAGRGARTPGPQKNQPCLHPSLGKLISADLSPGSRHKQPVQKMQKSGNGTQRGSTPNLPNPNIPIFNIKHDSCF